MTSHTLTPEQEQAIQAAAATLERVGQPALFSTILRDLVARVTEQARKGWDEDWKGRALLNIEAAQEEYQRREALRQRISTLEGLLREAVACVEIAERRDMGGQEWLDARRLRLRIEAAIRQEPEKAGRDEQEPDPMETHGMVWPRA
jgi:hypothetical protein